MRSPAPLLQAAALAAAIALTALPAEALGPAARAVDLGAEALALAAAGDGSLFVVGTADGVRAFDASGALRWSALAGSRVTAVAVDHRGAMVAAGDDLGLVHVLDGAGAGTALGAVLGPVLALAATHDGRSVVAGSEQGLVAVFDPLDATPPPLPNLPPAAVLLPQWSYNTQAPVTHVHVTGDGRFVVAGNGGESRAWQWASRGALLPGGMVPLFPDECLALGPLGPNCWTFGQFSTGGLHVLSGARTSYQMFISYGTGWSIATSAANFFENPWSFKAPGAPTAGAMSSTGSHVVVGDTFGNVYLLTTAPASPAHSKGALWQGPMGAEVAAAAISADGGLAAAADAEGDVSLFTRAGLRVWTQRLAAPPVGLAFTPSGSALVAAAGTQALFWS